MTAPADQHALREAPSPGALKLARQEGGAAGELCERIAWMLDPEAFQIWERAYAALAGAEVRGPTWDQLAVSGRRDTARKMASALIAGPLAPYLAAEAENTRLKETVEAGHAVIAAALNVKYPPSVPELDRLSDAVERFRALATIPPKENPDA